MVSYSPKRRRTDNGPISPEAIAQANSTSHIFTGHRQSSWMQAQPAPRTGDAGMGPRQTCERSTLAGVATVNPPTDGHVDVPTDARTSSDDADVVLVRETRGPGQAGAAGDPQAEGTLSDVLQKAAALQDQQNTSNPRQSSVDSVATMPPHPGLPSPVLTDDMLNSPRNRAMSAAAREQAPSRPQSINGANGPSLRAAGLPRVPNVFPPQGVMPHQYQPLLNARPSANNNIFTTGAVPNGSHTGPARGPQVVPARAHSNSPQTVQNNFSNGPRRAARPLVPSQPDIPVPQSPLLAVQQPQIDPQFYERMLLNMALALDTFQKAHKQQLPQNSIDNGRLCLLSDAVKQRDWFYIVLSQHHALKDVAPNPPPLLDGIGNQCFQYLNRLLCYNSMVHPRVLQWLAGFPISIDQASTPTLKPIYDANFHAVRNFLTSLPFEWESIWQESTARHVPPPIQELYRRLHMGSPVLLSTAVRAITRQIYESSSDSHAAAGLDAVETLQKHDIDLISRGARRNASEMQNADEILRSVFQAWKSFEPQVLAHEKREARLPRERKTPVPAFTLSQETVQFFQMRIPQGNSAGSPPIPSANGARAPSFSNIPAQRQARVDETGFASYTQAMASHGQSLTPTSMRNAAPLPVPPQKRPPGPHLMIPHENDQPRAQPAHPDTVRSGLHQAHLRSPILKPVDTQSNESSLFRYIKEFPLSPTRIDPQMPIESWTFNVPQHYYERIPRDLPPHRAGERATRPLDEQSYIYRLRCAETKKFHKEHEWVIVENHWPDTLHVELNGVMLEPRRKLHHGRHLPIDLTPHIVPGINRLEIIPGRATPDPRPFSYSLGIDLIAVTSTHALTTALHHLPAALSLAQIRSSLAQIPETADDDLAVTSSTLTIPLFDPYTNARIFSTPVRGAHCKHRACFDLDTFLSQCARDAPDQPAKVDVWRCPICRGDVRPQALVVDEFLVGVREALEKGGLLGTRAIVVEADGGWRVKGEERNGVRSESLEVEEGRRRSEGVGAGQVRKAVEVIELD